MAMRSATSLFFIYQCHSHNKQLCNVFLSRLLKRQNQMGVLPFSATQDHQTKICNIKAIRKHSCIYLNVYLGNSNYMEHKTWEKPYRQNENQQLPLPQVYHLARQAVSLGAWPSTIPSSYGQHEVSTNTQKAVRMTGTQQAPNRT